MIHRDQMKAAKTQADFIELIENTSGFAGVYPEDKFAIVEGFQNANHKVNGDEFRSALVRSHNHPRARWP